MQQAQLPEVQRPVFMRNMQGFKRYSLTSVFLLSDKFSIIYQLGSSTILPQNAKQEKLIFIGF
jgi:hypothetical protein